MGEDGVILREYQREAIEATWAFLRERTGSPLVVIPTGGGKSAILTSMCRQAVEVWGGRVLVLTHVKELIEQLAETINRVWQTGRGKAPVGIYSAGIGRRETDQPVIIAGIQSVYRRGTELGRFDLVIVDEAHLVPRDGEGMYLSLLSTLRVINPQLRLIGLTATPYRLDSGYLFGGEGALFEDVCYEAGVRALIDQGFLSPLRGKNGGEPDLSGVHKRGGEYMADELEAAMTDEKKVAHACEEIERHGLHRKKWLVFCCGVKHAKMVADRLWARGVRVHPIFGDTPPEQRNGAIRSFRDQGLQCLVNVNVLTTGFDVPHVDLVALLRPTCSPGLYYQMVGRGLRKAPGKTDCLILDLGGNIQRHGPVDAIRVKVKDEDGEPGEAPVKTCPTCEEILPAAATMCNVCGFEFPREIARHEAKAANAQPLQTLTEEWVDVRMIDWCVHQKRGAPPESPKSLRIMYTYGVRSVVSEFVCVEHVGFARRKAEQWWHEHVGGECPKTAADADAIITHSAWAQPRRIKLRMGGEWPELVGKDMPMAGEDSDEPASVGPSDEVPF